MADFTFEFDADKQSEPTYQYRPRQCWDRFYERSPHFYFEETVTGELIIDELATDEARILGEALASGDRPYNPDLGTSEVLPNCIALDPSNLLASLEAIRLGNPFALPVRGSRTELYHAPKRKRLPEAIKVPAFAINSIAGNICQIRDIIAEVIKERLSEDAKSVEGTYDTDEYNRLIQRGIVAGGLALAAETTIRDGLDAVHGVTEDTLRAGFRVNISLGI